MKASHENRDEKKLESAVDAISTLPGHGRCAIVRICWPIGIFPSHRSVLQLADTGSVVSRCGLIKIFSSQWVVLHLPAVSVEGCCWMVENFTSLRNSLRLMSIPPSRSCVLVKATQSCSFFSLAKSFNRRRHTSRILQINFTVNAGQCKSKN